MSMRSHQTEPATVDFNPTVSKPDDLQPGLRLAGVIPGRNVSVIAAQPHGTDAICELSGTRPQNHSVPRIG